MLEDREHLPLTLGRVFYRLVGTVDFLKDERAYKRLCETAGKARPRELDPDGRHPRRRVDPRFDPRGWANRDEMLSAWRHEVATFRLNRQIEQPTQLYLWCEAGGIVPQLARIADPYGVTVISAGGFHQHAQQDDNDRPLSADDEGERGSGCRRRQHEELPGLKTLVRMRLARPPGVMRLPQRPTVGPPRGGPVLPRYVRSRSSSSRRSLSAGSSVASGWCRVVGVRNGGRQSQSRRRCRHDQDTGTAAPAD